MRLLWTFCSRIVVVPFSEAATEEAVEVVATNNKQTAAIVTMDVDEAIIFNLLLRYIREV
jgi:hypothetical protein